MSRPANGWIILRTSGSRTLALATSLAEDGFDVWTPVETRTERVAKANAKREVRLPIMPSYIFARVSHLVDLLEMAQMPVKPRRGTGLSKPAHSSFSVMHWFDGIPVIADAHLERLRRLEAKRTPMKKANTTFATGANVRVEGGSFGGMSGKVERSDNGFTLVCFRARLSVKIPTSILRLDEVQDGNIVVKAA